MTIWHKLKVLSNYIFVGLLVVITFVGLVKTLCFPDEMSEYENRYAEQVEKLTLSSYLDGTFQDSMDNALGDQVTLSSTFKVLYNRLNTALQNLTSKPILNSVEYFQDHYFWIGGTRVFNVDTLVYGTYPESELKKLDERIENYNSIFAAFPDTEFFCITLKRIRI